MPAPNTVAYGVHLKEKYQNTAEYFDAYQVKETAAVKPFERQEHEPADEKERKKYEKYYYGRYKGENIEGVPHGQGKLQWDLPNSDLIQSTSGVRKLFRGQLQQGMLLSGYLEFYCKSFYIGDFNPTNNKLHGAGRFSQTDDIYYQGYWVNGHRHG